MGHPTDLSHSLATSEGQKGEFSRENMAEGARCNRRLRRRLALNFNCLRKLPEIGHISRQRIYKR